MTLSLFGLNSFSFRDPARQIPWTVRLLAQGQPFGLNFALKHDSAMPVVEFYPKGRQESPVLQVGDELAC